MDTYERWLRGANREFSEGEKDPLQVAFLAGGALSFADICLFDCIQAIEEVGYFSPEDRIASYPLVTALYDHVGNIPAVSNYMAARESRFN